jgi:hypothetical protein
MKNYLTKTVLLMTVIMRVISTSASSKTCEVFIQNSSSTQKNVGVRCSGNENNSPPQSYTSDKLANEAFEMLNQSFGKIWARSGCGYNHERRETICMYKELSNAQTIISRVGHNLLTECEKYQLQSASNFKHDVAKNALLGFGGGAAVGFAVSSSFLTFFSPFVFTAAVFDKGKTDPFHTLFSVIIKTTLAVGVAGIIVYTLPESYSQWFKKQKSEQLLARNINFLRDIRNNGNGPEIDTWTYLILDNLNNTTVSLAKIDNTDAFSYKETTELVNNLASNMISLRTQIPKNFFKKEDIKSDLKYVGENFLALKDFSNCAKPDELQMRIIVTAMSRSLKRFAESNKLINNLR